VKGKDEAMAGCGCSIAPDGGASKRNAAVCDLPDAQLFAQMQTALDRFDALARHPLLGFVVYAVGFADRERQRMTGLEFQRLRVMAGEPVPAGLDTGRMVWVPVAGFRDLMAKAEARRGDWEAVGKSDAAGAAAA
jgi:hypothetical protein